jgi:hypothetical protein
MTALRLALAILAVGLGVAFAWMTDWGRDIVDGPEIAAKKASGKFESATVLPDFKLGSDASTYAQIVDRPLLNPTRKPAPTQPIALVAPEPPKPQIRRGLYQLIGVTDLGSVKLAQVREVATRRVTSVRLGDALQELRVKKITPESITLAFESEEDILSLAKYTPSGQVPPPSTPPPQPPAVNPMVAASATPPGVPQQVPSPVSAIAPAIPLAAQPSATGGVNPGAPGDSTAAAPASAPPPRAATSMRERLGIGRNRPPSETPPPSPAPQ